jgi:hypothetical protein
MTTPDPTRQEADAWWERLTNAARTGIATPWKAYRTLLPTDEWWRSLPDERAVTIYREERG